VTLSVLVVDDDTTVRETLVEFFETFGHTARSAGTASEARAMAAEHAPDVVLLDLRLPDASGLLLLDALRADDPDVGVIVLSGFADVRTTVGAMQRGAVDVLEKPVDLDALAAAVTRASERGRLRQELALLRARDRQLDAHADHAPPAPLPRTFEELLALAARNADAPVLLQGETGTGKGYVARQIHDRSSRRDAPFVEINCASLTSTFFESELFGHERGAFTDARTAKRGLLEVAGSGTVFLDEVAEMPLEVQPKLLKVIEEHSFRRLGGTTSLRNSARLVVATNEPLAAAVETKRFRADLYYRLQVLTILLPPLRERREEIVPLAQALLPRGARLGAAAESALLAYSWPGNIRELRNTLWRASILADGQPIGVAHLGLSEGPPVPPDASSAAPAVLTLADAERQAIAAALTACEGNRTHAAEALGIARSTLVEKLKRYPELAPTDGNR
jgi:DNA-binding NtrC family response regulator